MRILIKSLAIVNFKGIKNLKLKLNESITNIFGDNATGKTTISDAFHWLFFGKESTDRKDFNIKNTVDTSLNRKDHEVSAIINVGSSDIEVKRVFREKWTKKRGAEEAEFTGNETLYFWDNVPLSQTDFNKKISSLIDEKVFKLISNPSYFNTLKWQERRQILFNIAGDVSNEDIAGTNPKFQALLQQLTNSKTLEEYKKQVSSQRKKIKDELEEIPTRIDEVHQSMPEMGDASLIKRAIGDKETKIKYIEDRMADRSKAMNEVYEVIREHQQEIFKLQSMLDRISNEVMGAIKESIDNVQKEKSIVFREVQLKEAERNQLMMQNNRRIAEIESINQQIAGKRAEWNNLNIEKGKVVSETLVFDDHEFTCPTCSRLFDAEDIEAKKELLLQNFNARKETTILEFNKKMATCVDQANSLKADLERLQTLDNSKEIEDLDFEINALKEKLEFINSAHNTPMPTYEEQLLGHTEYQKISKELNILQANAPVEPKVDLTDLQNEKKDLEAEIRLFERELSKEPIINNAKNRIASLEEEEKRLANELSLLEGQEFIIEAFNRRKVEEVEERINRLFQIVKFKMYDLQINGAEAETCETMFEGVPYSDLNNASRINAGLDIINALSRYYGVSAPIFIDNAESVTKLIDVDSQVIRLIVSEEDKELRVA